MDFEFNEDWNGINEDFKKLRLLLKNNNKEVITKFDIIIIIIYFRMKFKKFFLIFKINILNVENY